METIKLPKDRKGFVVIGSKETIRVDLLVEMVERKRLGKVADEGKHDITFNVKSSSDFKTWLQEERTWQG